ncbi:MAG: hypothetical protein ABMA02_19455 [Saprospiraceae bacterium]
MNDSTLLDSLIYTGIVLLILSQITEKVTTFLRSYINVIEGPLRKTGKRRRSKTRLQKVIARMLRTLAVLDDVSDLAKSRIKQVETEDKTKIEFAITKLSILVGFVIALSFKANLFAIFLSGNPHQQLGWSGYQWEAIDLLYQVFGCLATGFLLTFGSKFFHDLLETLYEVKRLRRKLADEATFRSPDLESLDQRLAAKYDDPVLAVFERHKDRLLAQFSDIVSIARAFDKNGTSYLEIRARGNNIEPLRQYEFDYLEGDTVKTLHPIKIKLVPNADYATPLGDGSLWVGDWTFNLASPRNRGTLGFFSKRKGKAVLVTCYHVLRTEAHGWVNLGNTTDNQNKVFGKVLSEEFPVLIGRLVDGKINNRIDGAVVELIPELDYRNNDAAYGEFTIGDSTSVAKDDPLSVNGAKSPPGAGVLHCRENSVRIKYGSKIIALDDLLCLKNKADETQSLTQKGDSGAVVIDAKKQAVAMVVAGEGPLTYAIPMERLIKCLDLDAE